MSGDSTAVPVVYEPVKDFPGYRVGTDGSVWTCKVHLGGGNWIMSDEWRRMKPRVDKKTGYLSIGLRAGGKQRIFLLHRLILETFVGPCPESKEGAHENGIKADCRLSNLAWKTPLENHADKKRHGTLARGVTQWKAKLNDEKVRAIRLNPEKLNGEQLAKQHGTTRATINKILRGETWVHVI